MEIGSLCRRRVVFTHLFGLWPPWKFRKWRPCIPYVPVSWTPSLHRWIWRAVCRMACTGHRTRKVWREHLVRRVCWRIRILLRWSSSHWVDLLRRTSPLSTTKNFCGPVKRHDYMSGIRRCMRANRPWTVLPCTFLRLLSIYSGCLNASTIL